MLRLSAVGGKLPLIITVAWGGNTGGKGWVSIFIGYLLRCFAALAFYQRGIRSRLRWQNAEVTLHE